MSYTQKVKDFLAMKTVSDTYLIQTWFTDAELQSICTAPNIDVATAYIKKQVARPVKEPKTKAVKYVRKPKMVDSDLTYEERLQKEGYKRLDFRTRVLTSKHKSI